MSSPFGTPDYIRIVDPVPQDELVANHDLVIREFRTRLLKRRRVPELMVTLNGLFGLFYDSSSIPDNVARQIEDAFRKIDGSFARDGRNLELGVCGLAAVNRSILSGKETANRDGWNVPDVIAGCVWSALSFLPSCQGKRLEALRRCTIGIARHRFCATGSAARIRHKVAGKEEIGLGLRNRNGATAAARAIRQLESNATFDREENDVLRWVLDGRSRIHGRPLRELAAECRAITTGVEIGTLLRMAPTQFHRDLLSCGGADGVSLSLTGLLERIENEMVPIADSLIDRSVIRRAPLVFPLLSAICSGDATGPAAHVRRTLYEWRTRALIERVLVDIEL